ncbi:class I SAM-dependent DNA methyltransferase [Frigidibacter sp. MR17.24]|uniref:class I SAM-dependent DNA methyltransferase n=1 Tax=Frigidibacter sp. MR17.24 TaxID=3127345 RepID=UPI003012D2F5
MAGHEGHLGQVYAAAAPEDIARAYDAWAETYDSEMARNGYCHPAVCLALLSRHLAPGPAPILDAGCGTGLMGDWLAILGYPRVEGLDLSEGMLARARAKGRYSALHRLALGQPLPFADGAYAGVVSTGVFTTGHVGAEALPELIRVTRPGGVLSITVKDTVWEQGFAAAIAHEVDAGRLAWLEETPPYVSMPGDAATIPGRCIALSRA